MTRPRSLRLPATLLLLLALVLAAATPAPGQGLPIPGLPGGLGGVPSAPAPAPADAPPQAPPGAVTQDPAAARQALIDLLRDEAAREALIRELEAGAGALPPPEGPQAPGTSPATDPAAAAPAPPPTVGQVAVAWTQARLEVAAQEAQKVWLRAQRVPNTLRVSLRAFEGDLLRTAALEAGRVALVLYAILFLLRRAVGPLRRRLAGAGVEAGWTLRLVLRIGATALDAITVPVAAFLGAIVTASVGVIEVERITDAEALIFNAFGVIELTRVAVRFVLSPRSPELRMTGLPEPAVRSLWRVASVLIYGLGVAQLVFVPIVSSGISIFVGRAFSAVLGATAVLALIVYVLVHRRRVAGWLHPEDSDGMLADMLGPLARLWHWPVLGYLLYLFVTVLTQPGNVLLPLLWTTAKAALVVALGAMVMAALGDGSSRRLRVPDSLGRRLPLLEERLNQLVPALLGILRVFVLLAIVVLVLQMLGVQTLGGLITSDYAAWLASGLFSVLLVVVLLAVVWLALSSWVDYRLNPFVGSVPTPREITLLTLLRNAVTVVLIVLGVIMSLAQLGMNIGPLLASAGVLGLAISFGAQRMVEDIFSGIFIQAEGAMNVGDVVDAGGTVGTVEKLTVRSVTLRDLSGVVHIIPFSSAAKISNFMRDFSYHVADIGVAYRENVAEVRAAMEEAYARLRADPELGPTLLDSIEWFGLNAFGASELVMRARLKTLPGQQWGVGRAYNALVKEVFDERGIEIPFPHQTVYFGEDKAGRAPAMHLRVERPDRGGAAPGPGTPAEAAAPAAAATERDDAPAPAADIDASVRGRDMPDADGR